MTDYDYLENAIMNGVVAVMTGIGFLFVGVCILIFCLSSSRTKSFLRQTTQENYRKANGFHVASIVFTVLIALFTLSGITGFFTALLDVFTEQDPTYRMWDIVEIAEFALAAVALILGIRALASFGKARTLCSRIYPPGIPPYNNQQYPQQNYPRKDYTQQNYPQQSYTQQSYPQQSYPQQNYPQQSYPRRNYPQPSNPQQNYPQQSNSLQNPPQQSNPQQNTYTTPTPPAPAEKMCPSCGVVNDGKNKFCIFCGKPL